MLQLTCLISIYTSKTSTKVLNCSFGIHSSSPIFEGDSPIFVINTHLATILRLIFEPYQLLIISVTFDARILLVSFPSTYISVTALNASFSCSKGFFYLFLLFMPELTHKILDIELDDDIDDFDLDDINTVRELTLAKALILLLYQ